MARNDNPSFQIISIHYFISAHGMSGSTDVPEAQGTSAAHSEILRLMDRACRG